MGSRGELGFVQAMRARAGRQARHSGVRVGIGDDCAVLRPRAGQDIVVTTDFCMEGRHFRRDWHSAESAGHRCLARGLSDLAAMGATPLSAFLSFAVPEGLRGTAAGRRWVEDFVEGLFRLADATGTPVSGGDTATAPGDAVLADIVLVGSVPRDKALLRDGARAGDRLFVTGALGGAAAELRTLAEKPGRPSRRKAAEALAGEDGRHPQLFPEPRLRVGRALVRRGLASAAMDLSDGLSSDLRRMCEASGVGAVIDARLLPVHGLARHAADARELALHGGEDYELLFTARPGVRVPGRLAGTAITQIGEMTAGSAIVLRDGDGERPLEAGGWEHAL